MSSATLNLKPEDMRIAIICGRFNETVTKPLLAGAKDQLLSYGLKEAHIHEFWVPGAFELPVVAQKAASSKEYDAIICLGAVIKGETPHFHYICSAVASQLSHIAVNSGKPVIFGVLTTDTVDQALNRAGLKYGNKGREAASAAVDTLKTLAAL